LKGIIIAGGFGTRLHPLTHHRPKHLLPLGNRPFLEYQAALLRRHGIREIVLAANYLAGMIQAHFGDGSSFGVRMQCALEETPLGTAGAIRNAARHALGERVIVLNGDILTDFDLGAVLRFHEERGAAATIALRAVERPHAFGVLDTDPEGRVAYWREPSEEEKRRVAASPGPPTGEFDFINAGIYVLEPEVVEGIPEGRPASIERETFPALIQSGAPVYGIAPEGFWLDMGRPEQYLAASRAILTRVVDTDVPFQPVAGDARVAPGAEIDAETSLGPGVRVEEGARIQASIILAGSSVGPGARIRGGIVDERVRIGAEAEVRPGAVLAAGSILERGSRI